MNKIAKYVLPTLIVGIFSGCASNLKNEVTIPYSKVIENKSKSYITFSRPSYLGAALSNTVIEFNPNNKDTKLVGILGGSNKIIYKTNPGTHYFYMSGGENDDMIKINTKENTMYYVETQPSFGFVSGRFYFEPYKKSLLKTELIGNECTDELLKEYDFGKVEDQYSVNEVYQSDKLKIKMECYSGKVKNIKNLTGYSIEDLNNATLIEPNEKAFIEYKKNLNDYISEIEEDYKDWAEEDVFKTEMKIDDGYELKDTK